MCDINDIRSLKEFRSETFSKFHKSKVQKELCICINSNKLEPACYWSAELICAGQFSDLWEIIIMCLGKFIYIGSPKLPIYISIRFNEFKNILNNGYVGNELALRNNIKIRRLFGEIISILCESRKKHRIEQIKINKLEDFEINIMAEKLKASHIKYLDSIFQKGDPKELFIPLNELSYNIEIKNTVEACYWVEWILEYQKLCDKKKESYKCQRRTFVKINQIYQMDPIWIVWEIINSHIKNKLCGKIIDALLTIFCIKYSPSIKKKRRYIIYFAISLLTEEYSNNVSIITDKNKINSVVNKINIIYNEVKKNEIAPNTDYLFNGLEKNKSNLEKTIEKLEKMNSLIF